MQARSAITADGCQKAPMAFFERVPLMPVFQKPRRHSDQANSSLPHRRGESRQVPHRSAAHRDDATAAIDALPLEERKHLLQLCDRLRTLTRRDHMDRSFQAGALDRLGDLDRPRPDIGVGDDRGACRVQPRYDAAQLAIEIAPDDHRVASC
jgi:hypothetical protein